MSGPWDWDSFLDHVSVNVPGYGELHSFNKMVGGARSGDKSTEVKGAISLVGCAIRDISLVFAPEYTVPATIIVGIGQAIGDEVHKLMFPPSIESLKPGKVNIPQGVEVPKRDCHLLIGGENGIKSRQTSDMLRNSKEFLAAFHYRRVVYYGLVSKIGLLQSDSIFVCFPAGITNGGPCQIFTTFTEAAMGGETVSRPVAYITIPMTVNYQQASFTVMPTGRTPYSWHGQIVEDRSSTPMRHQLSLEIKDGDGQKLLGSMKLTLLEQNVIPPGPRLFIRNPDNGGSGGTDFDSTAQDTDYVSSMKVFTYNGPGDHEIVKGVKLGWTSISGTHEHLFGNTSTAIRDNIHSI